MNHDNEYHDDVNYGNRFPEGWYHISEEDSVLVNSQQTQSDYAKCYKPYRTLHNY